MDFSGDASKKSISLRPRLSETLKLLGKCGCLADIGCDHGRFSVAVIQHHAAKSVIASDISAASLEKAKLLAIRCGCSGQIEFRCTDGFGGFVPGEIDKAVLTGMGGELIVSILKANTPVVDMLENIVMQPMRGESELREYLYTNGFSVHDEKVVFDSGRYYQIISARRGEPSPIPSFWPENFWRFGPAAFLKHDENLPGLMKVYLSTLNRKLESAEAKGRAPDVLIREKANTEKLIRLFDAGSGVS